MALNTAGTSSFSILSRSTDEVACKQKGYERRTKERNKINKRQQNALERNLQNWYERTHTPTVALTLVSTKDGDLCVKYSGPREFEEFGRNEEVQKIFYKTVMEGMARSHVKLATSNTEETEMPEQEVDEFLINLVLASNVLSFGLDEKRKLLTQIITGVDMSKKNMWRKEAIPAWWPESIDFRSPNERKSGYSSMPVDAIDDVLSAFITFIRTCNGELVGDESDVAEEDLEHEEQSSVSTVQDIHLSGIANERNVDQDVRGAACGAEAQCYTNFGEYASDQVSVCSKCSKWFHRECFDLIVDEDGAVDCGCSRLSNTLLSKPKFRSKEGLAYLFRCWDSELKKFAKEVVCEKRFSPRFWLYKTGQYRKLEQEGLDYLWLIGDDMDGLLQHYVIRLGLSIPYIRKIKDDQKRYGFNHFVFDFEVLAFMLHKEEGIPIAHARLLLSGPEN